MITCNEGCRLQRDTTLHREGQHPRAVHGDVDDHAGRTNSLIHRVLQAHCVIICRDIRRIFVYRVLLIAYYRYCSTCSHHDGTDFNNTVHHLRDTTLYKVGHIPVAAHTSVSCTAITPKSTFLSTFTVQPKPPCAVIRFLPFQQIVDVN